MSNVAIISDFNVDLLGRQLADLDEELSIKEMAFGQVFQSVNKVCADETIDTVVVWVRPESFSAKYKEALQFNGYQLNEVEDEMALLLDAVTKLAACKKHVFFINYTLPTNHRGLGAGDYKQGQGLAYLCNHLNYKACNDIGQLNNVYILEQQRWFAQTDQICNPKLWYAGKILFSPAVFQLAAQDINAGLLAAEGKSRRLVVIDLDNTMWGGILGDVGVEGLNLGGHNYQGEAFVDFQKGLKALKNRGILLALASKNYEDNALNAIENHAEMVLRKEDFVTWQINWEDKAKNIVKIAQAVNLGLSSVVFLDDNPAERGRVKEALPEVFVPDWPEEPCDYLSALLSLTCFDSSGISEEDTRRSQMFAEQQQRSNAQKNVSSDEEWLASIGMEVFIEEVSKENMSRTLQLLNKTNQFNLKTRRLSEPQFVDWLNEPNHQLWTVRVKDKFGDSGLTGIFSISFHNELAQVEDFILSCRVMGRNIEDVMLAMVFDFALERGCSALHVKYVQSERNKPILEFLQRTKLLQQDGSVYYCNEVEKPQRPSFIQVNT